MLRLGDGERHLPRLIKNSDTKKAFTVLGQVGWKKKYSICKKKQGEKLHFR